MKKRENKTVEFIKKLKYANDKFMEAILFGKEKGTDFPQGILNDMLAQNSRIMSYIPIYYKRPIKLPVNPELEAALFEDSVLEKKGN